MARRDWVLARKARERLSLENCFVSEERCIAGRLIGILFKWTAYSCLLSSADDYMHEAIKILFTSFFFVSFCSPQSLMI